MRRRAAAGALLLAAVAAACGGHPAPGQGAAPNAPAPATMSVPATSRPAARVVPSGPGPGALPQTTASPSAAEPAFAARMQLLWDGILRGQAQPAAFFPLPAYLQVKAISDAGLDYQRRLMADYLLDVAAAHRIVAPGSQLVGVRVDAADARWIPPGFCYNRIGYWHVGGSRLVYRSGAAVRSFGIASLISWRGQWYVVHLGAVLRTSQVGIVDDPLTGPGVAGTTGGC